MHLLKVFYRKEQGTNYTKRKLMLFLISMPGGAEWILILFIPCVMIAVPIITYFWGFRNGKREGERIQLQKQVNALK